MPTMVVVIRCHLRCSRSRWPAGTCASCWPRSPACLRAALAHTSPTCWVGELDWSDSAARVAAHWGRAHDLSRRWSGRCERPSPARHWRRGRRGDLRACACSGRSSADPPAHHVSGHFRSGSVIAPMPAGRDPRTMSQVEKRAEPGHDQAARHTTKEQDSCPLMSSRPWCATGCSGIPGSTATRSSCRQTTARSPNEHGEGQAPRSGCRASPGSATRTSGRVRRCGHWLPISRNLKARLDAYSERQLDEMDKYQNRKVI